MAAVRDGEVTRGAHASTASGLSFCPFRVRTKTCPLFQSPSVPFASPATASGKLSCRTCIPAASGLGFCLPGCEPKPVRFFDRPSVPLASPVTASGKLSCRTCVPAASGLNFCLPGCEPKPVRFFSFGKLGHPIRHEPGCGCK
jgi:hypothetical protein